MATLFRFKRLFLTHCVRQIPGRRRLILLFMCTVLVCIQMWHPVELQLYSRSTLSKLYLKHFNYTLSQNNVSHNSENRFIKFASDFPYKYLISEPNYCSDRSDLYIINVVGTAPWEVKARNRIRRLWANETYRNLTGFSTVFIIGQVTDLEMMENVKKESSKFHDIVLVDVMDSYNNLTLKTLVMLHWVDSFCHTPTWVLKSDSDVFVNPFRLLGYLYYFQHKSKNWHNTLVCKKRGPAAPCREGCPHAKWRVTREEYPANKYPVYCQGPGYVIPRHLVGALYEAANKTHPFRMEDVYYTGILPHKIKKGNIKKNIASRFPWRPRAWQSSFVKRDLMILELDKGLGRGASSLVWSNILKERGLISEVKNITISQEATET